MIFNSLHFVGFFAFVFGLVWLAIRLGGARVAPRNACILVASYVFYGTWDWRFLALIWVSTAVDYAIGLGIANAGRGPEGERRRKALVTASLAVNLSLLGFFKYFGFFVQGALELLSALGFAAHAPTLSIILPVGISFYTFQTLSYTIDVYRGDAPAERNLLNYAAYVAFFPQLVAGPIERGATLLPQFARRSRIRAVDVSEGLRLAAWGLVKKVVVADNVAKVADSVFALEDPVAVQVWIGAYAFAFQIYCDFSGYSDIARGTARCLGFELSRNFDHPYFSASPSEFWSRWHISLSTWLRDYLYIPLGGNRGGQARTTRNLMVTMLLGGLWHGAALTFVAWGVFHGLLLCALRPLRARALPGGPFVRGCLRFAAIVGFFHLVCIGWIFFRAEDLGQAAAFLSALWDWPSGSWLPLLDAVGPFRLAVIVVGGLLSIELFHFLGGERAAFGRRPAWVRGVVYAAGVVVFLWIGEYRGPEFIYFQF